MLPVAPPFFNGIVIRYALPAL